MEESALPKQQPIFMGGKLPLKPGLLLEATIVIKCRNLSLFALIKCILFDIMLLFWSCCRDKTKDRDTVRAILQ